MARTKGAVNKQAKLPEIYTLGLDDRLETVAMLIVEILGEELCMTD